MLTLVKNNTPVENPTKYFEDFKSKVKQSIIKRIALAILAYSGTIIFIYFCSNSSQKTISKKPNSSSIDLKFSPLRINSFIFAPIFLCSMIKIFFIMTKPFIRSFKSLNCLLKESPNKKLKNALVIIADPDSEGSVDIEKPGLFESYDFSFLSSLAKTQNLFIHQVGSISELKKALNKKTNFYDTLLINAHSGVPSGKDSNFIILDIYDDKLESNLKNENLLPSSVNASVFKIFKKFIKYFDLPIQSSEILSPRDFNCLKQDGRIILISHKTGKSENCIAKKLSQVAKNRLVFAPKYFIYSSEIKIINPKTTKVKMLYDKKDITSVYKNGTLQPLKLIS